MHIELLLEEPSAEVFMRGFLPKILPSGTTWNPIIFQGKPDLLRQLEGRLKGYSRWIPNEWKIVVLIDEDRQDCHKLKATVEKAAAYARLSTKSSPIGEDRFIVLNRIIVEELEAWFFGDIPALASAFPGVPLSLASKTAYRDSDRIGGGTWEALEKVLQRAGYYGGGLPKIEVARIMGIQIEAASNTSHSFKHFVTGIAALLKS